ncbi:MAG: hypothetical protein ABW168_06725 [Sedimenticola sp.]
MSTAALNVSSNVFAYTLAMISDIVRLRIMQQVAFELFDVLDVHRLAFSTSDTFNVSGAIFPKPSGDSRGGDCNVFDVFNNQLFGDCDAEYSTLMTANESNSIAYDTFVPPAYIQCPFDDDATPVAGNYSVKLFHTP